MGKKEKKIDKKKNKIMKKTRKKRYRAINRWRKLKEMKDGREEWVGM